MGYRLTSRGKLEAEVSTLSFVLTLLAAVVMLLPALALADTSQQTVDRFYQLTTQKDTAALLALLNQADEPRHKVAITDVLGKLGPPTIAERLSGIRRELRRSERYLAPHLDVALMRIQNRSMSKAEQIRMAMDQLAQIERSEQYHPIEENWQSELLIYLSDLGAGEQLERLGTRVRHPLMQVHREYSELPAFHYAYWKVKIEQLMPQEQVTILLDQMRQRPGHIRQARGIAALFIELGPSIVPYLIEALNQLPVNVLDEPPMTTNRTVGLYVAKALAEIGDPAAIPALERFGDAGHGKFRILAEIIGQQRKRLSQFSLLYTMPSFH